MPEISKDASILIGISWQALGRAKSGNEVTKMADCTVALVFAGFYIEANLNQIVEATNKKQEMLDFLDNKKPGLQDKLAWFYNSFATQSKIDSRKDFKKRKKNIYDLIRVKFPGFDEIYNFRNDISHGKIDTSTANLSDAEKLRKQAKIIVDELFNLAEQAGYRIPRNTTYYDAIT
jgi:hypothetical protein